MTKNIEPERIIKEHRKWTQWIQTPRKLRLGNLVLTNRRLIFLNIIQSSPEVNESIKKLADAPIEIVLNQAFKLNGDNFQIPLSAIAGLKIGAYNWTPIPHVCLSVVYYDGKNPQNRMVAFQFIRPYKQTILKPQIILLFDWIRAIKKAIQDTDSGK
ncbi:MAG: hypothetical protein ACLPVI_00920 [Dehalococcoidales bacterium]